MAYNNTVKNDCQRRKGAYKKMKEKDCLKELRAIKDGTFATVDEKGCPQARIIDVTGEGFSPSAHAGREGGRCSHE